ncbi:aminodeoxychorismate/anthranilate synthase component II [Candidatus Gracilibacteria bacterium]|jgi:anthranilate synthase component 2|nr:aminodeoxychorismate/anthranilate synthase component II [Candidatus Gracilibacteria bacterium]
MILLIDNYDSFTYNLYQLIEKLGEETKVVKNDEISINEIKKIKPSKIIISPGPGNPKDSGISKKIIETFYKEIPILGVCLGHQCIGEIFGSKVLHAKKMMHGKTSKIYHFKNSIFKNIKSPFIGARYHSLIVDKVPKDFTLTAWTSDGEIMGIRHSKYNLFGVQFHPESFMTGQGEKIMKNFLNEK